MITKPSRRCLLGTAGALILVAPLASAQAAGGSGNVTPTAVHVEGGNVYIQGSFSNPDGCAMSTSIALAPVNTDEQQRMVSMAMTAIVANKKISMWLSGCGPTPWSASAPKAVAMTLVTG